MIVTAIWCFTGKGPRKLPGLVVADLCLLGLTRLRRRRRRWEEVEELVDHVAVRILLMLPQNFVEGFVEDAIRSVPCNLARAHNENVVAVLAVLWVPQHATGLCLKRQGLALALLFGQMVLTRGVERHQMGHVGDLLEHQLVGSLVSGARYVCPVDSVYSWVK
jgi:hypothetical protein